MPGIRPDRVAVFIDWQNFFNDARRAFSGAFTPNPWFGQIYPMQLGRLLCERTAPGAWPREIDQVRIYRGRPDATKEPKTYGAHMKQCDSWEKAGAAVIYRPLRYPHEWPNERAEEKGIDVELSIDLVVGAMNEDFEVAIVVSTDTDLRPALEAIYKFPDTLKRPTLEVCAWSSPTFAKQLRVKGRQIWCHRLDEQDYRALADETDYNAA